MPLLEGGNINQIGGAALLAFHLKVKLLLLGGVSSGWVVLWKPQLKYKKWNCACRIVAVGLSPTLDNKNACTDATILVRCVHVLMRPHILVWLRTRTDVPILVWLWTCTDAPILVRCVHVCLAFCEDLLTTASTERTFQTYISTNTWWAMWGCPCSLIDNIMHCNVALTIHKYNTKNLWAMWGIPWDMLTTANSLQCCTARKYQTYMVSNAIVGYVCLAFCADLLKTANTEWDDLLSPSCRMAVLRNGGAGIMYHMCIMCVNNILCIHLQNGCNCYC